MKEQILVVFTFENVGLAIDFSRGGDVEVDILEEVGSYAIDDLGIPEPSDPTGIWIWEGYVDYDRVAYETEEEIDLNYVGNWRRLSLEEAALMADGKRVIKDIVDLRLYVN